MEIKILDRQTQYPIYTGYVSLDYLKTLQQDPDFIIIEPKKEFEEVA